MGKVNTKEIAELITAITCVECQLMGKEGLETVEKLSRGFHILAEANAMDAALVEYFDKSVGQERLDVENDSPITTTWETVPDEDIVEGMFEAMRLLHPAEPEQEESVRWMEQFLREFYEGTNPTAL